MDKGIVIQHRATILPNVGITYILRIIFVRAIKRILPRNKGGWCNKGGPRVGNSAWLNAVQQRRHWR